MNERTQMPQRTVHYPTLDAAITARAHASGIDLERSTDLFLRAVRTNRGMRRDLLHQIEALMAQTRTSQVEHVDEQYLGAASSVLTGREMDVLLGYADGDESATIADDLGIGLETVKTYALKLYAKLGARTRAHAVALAYHHGILTPTRHPRGAA